MRHDPIPSQRESGAQELAVQAFEAHAALMKQQAANPRLRANEHWRALCDTALARAKAALEKA